MWAVTQASRCVSKQNRPNTSLLGLMLHSSMKILQCNWEFSVEELWGRDACQCHSEKYLALFPLSIIITTTRIMVSILWVLTMSPAACLAHLICHQAFQYRHLHRFFSPLTLLGIIERALHWNSEYLDPVPDLVIRWLCDLRKWLSLPYSQLY